ncbi:acyltransferase domain-containing protein [Streptomyces sp. NPDC007929]|uniref:ACP S-malonyltransferase n=1 Tax=unclassified Streptomyces TaxID=2593676 RepID=UPI0036E1FCCC
MSIKTAFVYPGQGSQFVGMGADLMRDRPELAKVFRHVEAVTGRPVIEPMVHGPEGRLRETRTAQLVLFTFGAAMTRSLVAEGVVPQLVAGHSLGEFTALVAGGWLDLDEAAVTVVQRADAMARCCHERAGAMAAVMGTDPDGVARVLARHPGRRDDGRPRTVVIANYNSPRQTVISGDAATVEEMGEAIRTESIGVVQHLSVAGAFHSPLMRPAQDALMATIARLPLRRGHTPMVSSVTGGLVTDLGHYRDALAHQITAPVRWTDAARRILGHRPHRIVEVGPGTTLRSLIRKVDRGQEIHPCGNTNDLRAVTCTRG